MIIKHINYYEHKGEQNFWQVNNISLSQNNLIIGINATGKTRLLNLIGNFAKIIAKKARFNGHFEFDFINKTNNYSYILEIEKDNIINNEVLKRNEKTLLDRQKGKGKIFSNTESKIIDFSPPENELTINVRRDTREYPYLEDLIQWANNVFAYSFSGVSPLFILTADTIESALNDMRSVPYLINKKIKNDKFREIILSDLKKIGYKIEEVKSIKKIINSAPNELLLAAIKENDVKCDIEQTQMSQGLFRALALIVIIGHIIELKEEITILIDDLGEGLDFARSVNLTKLLSEKVSGKKIQLIITSNNRFLINSFNMKDINILERKGSTVNAYNYENSKKLFDEFELTGLNNFDLFTSKVKI